MMEVEAEEAVKMKGFLGMEAPSTVGGEEVKDGEQNSQYASQVNASDVRLPSVPGKSVENAGPNTASLDAPGSVEGTATA